MKLICSLFIIFLKIGAFTFGGGYAMIALLENEFVEKKKWLGKSEFLDMVAVAESTPGPVAINSATYFIMKRLDDFLANNHHLIDEEIAENSLFIAFDNPMILDSLIPLFEKF